MPVTLAETCNQFFQTHSAPDFAPPDDDPVLWLHNMLHVILNLLPTTARDEEKVGIFQAVLLNSLDVDTNRKETVHGEDCVGLWETEKKVVPALQAFTDRIAAKHNRKVKTHLTDAEIFDTYLRAQLMWALIISEFERPLGCIPISELACTPTERMIKLVEQMEFVMST